MAEDKKTTPAVAKKQVITLESLKSIKATVKLRKSEGAKEFDETIYVPNGGNRTFGGSRNIPNVRKSELIAKPAYCLYKFPSLQSSTNATAAQMEFIAKQSSQSLLSLYNEASK